MTSQNSTFLQLSAIQRVEKIKTILEQSLNPSLLIVRDDSAAHIGHAGAQSGGHYHVTIISEAFQSQSRIKRHQLVYNCFPFLINNGIHALAISAFTKEEYSKKDFSN